MRRYWSEGCTFYQNVPLLSLQPAASLSGSHGTAVSFWDVSPSQNQLGGVGSVGRPRLAKPWHRTAVPALCPELGPCCQLHLDKALIH